jgi:cytochrome bd-type quinol oxidase subunit 1
MSTSWRISSFNGVLLAAYFIPTWIIIAFNIMVSPIHSLFERPSIAVALFISDHLHLTAANTVRAAWLLALGRLVVVAFFAIFTVLAFSPRIRKLGGCDEALSIALGIGCLISFVSMLLASLAGEGEALRLHASELLVMLGTVVVLTLERPAESQPEATLASA